MPIGSLEPLQPPFTPTGGPAGSGHPVAFRVRVSGIIAAAGSITDDTWEEGDPDWDEDDERWGQAVSAPGLVLAPPGVVTRAISQSGVVTFRETV